MTHWHRAGVFGFALMSGVMLLSVWTMPAAAQGSAFCEVDSSGIDFGEINPVERQRAHARGSMRIACRDMSGPVYACVMVSKLGDGRGQGNLHAMNGPGGSRLAFGLYSDGSMARSWGDGGMTLEGVPPLAVVQPDDGPSRAGSVTLPVYGAMLAEAESSAPGRYRADFSSGAISLVVSEQPIQDCRLAQGRRVGASFSVQAGVSAGCRIAGTDLDFGEAGILDRNIDAASELTIDCTRDTPFSISLQNAAGDTQDRHMRSSRGAVRYGIFMDSQRTRPWAQGGRDYQGTGDGGKRRVPVYGRVPPQATPAPGNYSDTVTAVISY